MQSNQTHVLARGATLAPIAYLAPEIPALSATFSTPAEISSIVAVISSADAACDCAFPENEDAVADILSEDSAREDAMSCTERRSESVVSH